MGKEGFDNLQTVNAGEISPLPQPKNRPGKGYHPAGQVENFQSYKVELTLGNSRLHGNVHDWNCFSESETRKVDRRSEKSCINCDFKL